MLSGSVGRAEIRHVQGILTTSNKQLLGDLLPGVKKALSPIRADAAKEAVTLPRRGGYAALIARALKVANRVTVSGTTIRATIRVSAKGRKETRDVMAVNRGRLRHPVWGNRSRWATTTVRPGFVSRPIDRAKDRVVAVAVKARDNLADKIVRG